MAKITAIILAAGQSRRFGQDNKLIAPYNGVPLIDHCLNTVLKVDFSDRILVTGFENERIEARIRDLPVRTVLNPDFTNGMGTSLAAGANALKPDCDAFMVFLADMPDIPAALINHLIKAYENNKDNKSIVRPVHKGNPGHPVLFSASYAQELKNLTDDQGAFEIVKKHKTSTLNVEVNSSAVVRNVNKLSDLKN